MLAPFSKFDCLIGMSPISSSQGGFHLQHFYSSSSLPPIMASNGKDKETFCTTLIRRFFALFYYSKNCL